MNRPAFLRDQPGDPEALNLQIEARQQLLDSLEPFERLLCLGELGSLYRSLQNYPAAQSYFKQALKLAITLKDFKRVAANLVRLGVAKHYAGQWTEAQACFEQVLEDSRLEFQAYHDFAWQHLGKLKVEQNELAFASDCFEQALALRQIKQDPELIRSTKLAIHVLEERRTSV